MIKVIKILRFEAVLTAGSARLQAAFSASVCLHVCACVCACIHIYNSMSLCARVVFVVCKCQWSKLPVYSMWYCWLVLWDSARSSCLHTLFCCSCFCCWYLLLLEYYTTLICLYFWYCCCCCCLFKFRSCETCWPHRSSRCPIRFSGCRSRAQRHPRRHGDGPGWARLPRGRRCR